MTAELDLARLLKEHEDEHDGEHPDLELIVEGDWEQEHKDQYCACVYKHTPTGRFVEITQNRRGSPWSDWDYGESDITEVTPQVVTVTKYVAVPQPKVSATPAAPSPGTP